MKYQIIREKMTRFNEWEAENRRKLTPEKRLEQFLALHDLSRLYDDDVRRKMHDEHLTSLVETHQRLHKIIKSQDDFM